MTAPAADPLDDAETDELFQSLLAVSTIFVAVSGGSDSTALMHLLAGWHRRHPSDARSIAILTVDHGLRAAAAEEAKSVALQASQLGFVHHTLVWAGAKPSHGLQAAARDARYRLLVQHILDARREPAAADILLTAHTADDQAETLLMRLQRGSGVDGLAAIPKHSRLWAEQGADHGSSVQVFRPLLTIARRRLIATLATQGIGWSDDPSNHNHRFERVRVRAALATLTDLGFTVEALQRSADRMQSAKAALEVWRDRVSEAAIRHVHGGAFTLDLDAIAQEPREIGIRVLRRLVETAGGAAKPATLTQVEAAFDRLNGLNPGCETAFTLGGTIIAPFRDRPSDRRLAWVAREPDRHGGLIAVTLVPGLPVNWDQRFFVRIAVGCTSADSLSIGALGADLPALLAELPVLQSLPIPAAAQRGLPVFRQRGQLVAAPTLAEFARDQGDVQAASALDGPRCSCHPDGGACLSVARSARLDRQKFAIPDET